MHLKYASKHWSKFQKQWKKDVLIPLLFMLCDTFTSFKTYNEYCEKLNLQIICWTWVSYNVASKYEMYKRGVKILTKRRSLDL